MILPGILSQQHGGYTPPPNPPAPWIGGINIGEDPYLYNVISLMHMDNLQDIVPSNTWIVVEPDTESTYPLPIQTNQHGPDSAFISSYSDLSVDDSASFLKLDSYLPFSIGDLNNGDCTIEFFYKYGNNTNGFLLTANYNPNYGDPISYPPTYSYNPLSSTSNLRIIHNSSGAGAVLLEYSWIKPNKDSMVMTGLTIPLNDITPGDWCHIAFVIKDNMITGYLDGNPVTPTVAINRIVDFIYAPGIYNQVILCKKDPNGGLLALDEFRVTKGIARYDSAFTRPVQEFATTP